MSLPLKKDAGAPPSRAAAAPVGGASAGPPIGPRSSRPGTPAPRTDSPGRGRQALAVLAVLFLSSLALAWLNQPPAPGGGKGPGPEKGWNLFLDLEGQRTISGRDIEIYGDVIVEKGADLRFVDCNLTVNGTFIVFGNLTFQGCRIGPYPAVQFYDFHRDDPGALTVSFDLSNRSRAALRFSTRHYLPGDQSVSVNVFSGGGWHNGQLVLKGSPHRIMNHTVDLAPFCGDRVKVEFLPRTVPNCSRDFQLFGLEVDSDGGALLAGDIDITVPRGSWYAFANPPPYRVLAQNASVVLSGSEVRKGSYLISGKSSNIVARATTVLGTESTSSGDYGYGYFVHAEGCSVEISDCAVRSTGIVQSNNSVVAIERTRASFGSTLASARNTDLALRECSFDNCSVGVQALVDREVGRGTLDMRNCSLTDCSYGIRLANQTGAVLGCDIDAANPFGLAPPRSLGRENCTAPAILALEGCRITVNATRYSDVHTGIQALSAIPIGGVYEWFRSSSWSAQSLYTRTLAVAYEPRDRQLYQWGSVGYSAPGSAVVLGPDFKPVGTGPRTVGPSNYMESYPFWDEWGYDHPLERRALHVETMERAGPVVYHNLTDESSLNFSLSTPDGLAFLDPDPAALRSPADVLVLDFVVMPVCDVTIRSMGLSGARGAELLVVDVGYNIDGLRHGYELAISVLLGGRQLVYDMECQNTYTLDALQVKDGGTLTVKVIPLGVTDINLSDNVASVAVRAFNNSCELAGPQPMEGCWVLKPGVDLVLAGCALNASGEDAAIVGMGRNRLSVERSTLEYDALLVNVSEARIGDSDLLPRGGARFRAEVGSFFMDNVTSGCLRKDHDERLKAARKELSDDPGLLESTPHWYSADWQNHRPSLSVDASDCIVNDSRFVDFHRFALVASGNCTLTGSSLVLGRSASLSAPRLRFERNLCEAVSDIWISGYDLSLLDSGFKDIPNGLTMDMEDGNLTATGNSFSRVLYAGSLSPGLHLHDSNRTDIRDNAFSGCQNGIYLFCDADPAGIFQNNTFQGVTNASVARWNRLNYEMYPSALGVDFVSEPYIRDATIAWADLFRERTNECSGWTSYGGGVRHMGATMDFVDGLVDAAGVARTLHVLELMISVSYSDGKERTFERTVPIPPERQWTERLQ